MSVPHWVAAVARGCDRPTPEAAVHEDEACFAVFNTFDSVRPFSCKFDSSLASFDARRSSEVHIETNVIAQVLTSVHNLRTYQRSTAHRKLLSLLMHSFDNLGVAVSLTDASETCKHVVIPFAVDVPEINSLSSFDYNCWRWVVWRHILLLLLN